MRRQVRMCALFGDTVVLPLPILCLAYTTVLYLADV